MGVGVPMVRFLHSEASNFQSGALSGERTSALDCEFRPIDLLRTAAFPHAVTELQLRETNLAWVVLTGRFAYKIKKAVTLSFVDQSTLAQRKGLCEEELRLNRRLAGDLYEAVVPITKDPDGLRVGGRVGPTVEFAVKMRQFEASQELAALLDRGTVAAAEIQAFATQLAVFHQNLPPASHAGGLQATQHLHDAVLGTLGTLLCHFDPDTQFPALGVLVDWMHDFLHDNLAVLQKREYGEHIRECHGDLHARNIVRWNGQLVPFDSLEFDPTLRWIDVMSDVAFLYMDLVSHGRNDLAFAFLNAYLAHGGDYDGVRLLRFYAIYHALVRAMVDELAAEGQTASRTAYLARGRNRLSTAVDLLQAPRPGLIIMHGLSGSGKSWVSARLAENLGALLVRSDIERKRLQRQTGAERIHTAQFDQSTYARLLACAESGLHGGVNVIIDAAFLEAHNRERFRTWAEAHSTPFIVASCRADLPVLEARIVSRQQLGIDPSDADLVELRRQTQLYVPPGEAEMPFLVEVNTMSKEAVSEAFARIRSKLNIGTRRSA
jgi:uncharacterized protein